ncbi:MAG: 2'-5' RNA ligase family protein [Bacillota bacterium]
MEMTTNHWEEYPFWTPERRYLICFLTFADAKEFVEAAQLIQKELRGAPIALSPKESLHQTMPGMCVREDISDNEIDKIRDILREKLTDYSSFNLSIDRIEADPEGIYIITKPKEELMKLHKLLHGAISETWGKSADGVAGEVYPHITIGYCNAVGDASKILSTAEKFKNIKGQTIVKHVDFIWLRREPDKYAWDLVERFYLK